MAVLGSPLLPQPLEVAPPEALFPPLPLPWPEPLGAALAPSPSTVKWVWPGRGSLMKAAPTATLCLPWGQRGRKGLSKLAPRPSFISPEVFTFKQPQCGGPWPVVLLLFQGLDPKRSLGLLCPPPPTHLEGAGPSAPSFSPAMRGSLTPRGSCWGHSPCTTLWHILLISALAKAAGGAGGALPRPCLAPDGTSPLEQAPALSPLNRNIFVSFWGGEGA